MALEPMNPSCELRDLRAKEHNLPESRLRLYSSEGRPLKGRDDG